MDRGEDSPSRGCRHAGWFFSVKEEVGLRGVCVNLCFARQKSKGHESVEKVACRARVQTKASGKGGEGLGPVRQFRENTHFDSAQECL